jgi:hypothetical protein
MKARLLINLRNCNRYRCLSRYPLNCNRRLRKLNHWVVTKR